MKVNYNIRTLFFILLTSIALEAASQSRHHIYNNQVKLSPFRIIDPVHSGIEISYEKKHVGNYSTQLSVAYFIKNNFSSNYEDYRGYRLGLEEKYFLPKRVRNIYLSVEAVYQKNSFQSTASFIHDSSNSAPSFHYVDSIKIHRRAAIINAG